MAMRGGRTLRLGSSSMPGASIRQMRRVVLPQACITSKFASVATLTTNSPLSRCCQAVSLISPSRKAMFTASMGGLVSHVVVELKGAAFTWPAASTGGDPIHRARHHTC
jgi:hypothetical protein